MVFADQILQISQYSLATTLVNNQITDFEQVGQNWSYPNWSITVAQLILPNSIIFPKVQIMMDQWDTIQGSIDCPYLGWSILNLNCTQMIPKVKFGQFLQLHEHPQHSHTNVIFRSRSVVNMHVNLWMKACPNEWGEPGKSPRKMEIVLMHRNFSLDLGSRYDKVPHLT